MRRKSFWIVFLLSSCFPLLIAAAQETPSLGDLARKAREQRKTSAESRTQTVESPGVGVRLVIPLDWKATDNRGGPFGKQLSIDCNPEYPGVCSILVESEALPRDKRAITDADLKEWKSQDPPAGFRRVAGRDWQVAGRPAREAIFEDPNGFRRRWVNILARDGGRLYKFECSAYWDSKDRLEEYAPAIDKVLESLSPVGQPTPQEVETAEIVSRFSAEERIGKRNVFNILLMELMCREMIQKYVPLDQVLNGCQARTEKEGGAISLSASLPEDPRRDPNYEYRVVARADTFDLSAAPKRKGLGGFFFDGQKIYFNPQGAASVSDKKIYEFKVPPGESASSAQPVAAPPAAPPAQPAKKKVWTEEDLASLRGPINVGGGGAASKPESPAATTPSAGSSQRQALRERGYFNRKELQAEERRAQEYVVAISELENRDCKPNLKRYCSLDELVQGVEVEPGRIVGFRAGMEPSSDPNYEYRIALRDASYEVSATPRRPGLGGLMHDGYTTHYNPKGSATKEDPFLTGPLTFGRLIRH
jgi:hypothetical protein